MSDLNVAVSPSGLVGIDQDRVATEALKKEAVIVEKPIEADKKPEEMSHEQVERAVEEVNVFMQTMQRNLSFRVDEQLGKEIISVTDKESEEVIRQIPSEDLVVLLKKLDDVAGILFDTKV